jgi:hypothetical protein
LPFRVRALVVDKRRIHSPQLRNRKDYFYNYFVRMLFEHDNDRLQGARVKIDGTGSHELVRALKVYLRQQLSEGKIAKLSFADSREDNLIQLADMVAGAIARSYREGSRDNPRRLDSQGAEGCSATPQAAGWANSGGSRNCVPRKSRAEPVDLYACSLL